jgi:hypothetical protein
MKIYFKFIGLLLFLFVDCGLLMPYLFSQESDMAVMLGVVVAIVNPVIVYLYIKWSLK